ncbi:MAG: type I-E CRISPR-associated protein Cse2/CasB [Candidatus Coatesbacteria bacterium]|nr:MAG: type I-E CRISPR-associated protein Cse2/CasB [Candidatus Coatesbacteria bacterium]
MEEEREEIWFINYLKSLVEDERKRGALAALRRGISGPPGTVPDTYPYVVPNLPTQISPDSRYAIPYFLVASLFALYFTGKGREQLKSEEEYNLGRAFRLAEEEDKKQSDKPEKKGKDDKDKGSSTERRFVALLNAHYDDLHNHLRHAISYLRSKDIPIDWQKLLKHIVNWNHPDRWVQKELAKGFWGYYEEKKGDESEKET